MAITFNAVSNNLNISTANANIDGTGSITTLLTGSAGNGTILDMIQIKSWDNNINTQGMIRIFIKSGAGGTYRLFHEVPVPSSNNQPLIGLYSDTVYFDLPIAPGDIIGISTETANNFNIVAFGYDITGFI